MEEIIELQKKVGFTLIFITHDMELAVVVADEILVMRKFSLNRAGRFFRRYFCIHQ